MSQPVDPLLPARLRRNAYVMRNERAVAGAWFSGAQSWMDEVRPGDMAPYRESNGTLPPDPRIAFGTATRQSWMDQVDSGPMAAIEHTARQPWESTLRGGPAVLARGFDQDPTIQDYLRSARNRLSNFPDEVYALIQRLIARGLDEGRSVQSVAEEIEELLTASATDRWRNRAITVARTETIGAANAGAFAGAQELANALGEENPQKTWLATDDTRTRPTHVIADGDTVGLTSPFIVGGFPLQFPGDPTGPPQEVINCRCSFLHVVAGETLDWTDRQFRQDADEVWDNYDLQAELEGLTNG